MLKYCPKCKITKDLINFDKNKNRKNNVSGYCKKCMKKYRNKNKEKTKKYNKKYRNENEEYFKGYKEIWHGKNKENRKKQMWVNHLKRQYNLTLLQYNKMIKHQNNKCVICGKKPSKRVLSVDHDHKTKKVRGLLCHKCNSGIGYFNDDILLMLKAINYIFIHKKN